MDQHFTIKCPRHPKRLCEVFTSQESPYSLLCIQCFQEEAVQPLSLVTIEDILNGDKNTILQNWPPLGSKTKEIFQNLTKIASPLDSQDPVQQVTTFFESAEKSLVEALRQKKKEILEQMTSFPNNSEQIIREYQSIAQIEQLKKVLTSGLNPQKIEQDLRSISQNQTNNIQINSDKLESIIKASQLFNTLTMNEAQQTLNQLILLPPNQFPIESQVKEYIINFQLELNKNSLENGIITCCNSNDSQFQIKTFKKKGTKDSGSYCQMTNSIKCNKKYIMKLQFLNCENFISSIYFSPLSQKNKNDFQISFKHNDYSTTYKIIKGKEIWSSQYYINKGQQEKEKVALVELRICIKDKYIVVLDRPSYLNAMSISSNPSDKFVSNSDYQLSFYIYGANDSITIQELKEVDKFPDI